MGETSMERGACEGGALAREGSGNKEEKGVWKVVSV